MTTDTLGGVWLYTRELVSGLVLRGHRVTLVSFGNLPSSQQTAWMSGLSGLEYRPTVFRLEWMQESAADVTESTRYLLSLVREVDPDLLHFNQFAFGALPVDLPRLVVAHSDVLSWWSAVEGSKLPETEWMQWYRGNVTDGLGQATAVVTPSQCMLDDLESNFELPPDRAVIYNGRSPKLFRAKISKINRVLSVGRLWDQAKQSVLLTRHPHRIPVVLVGQNSVDNASTEPTDTSRTPGVQFMGVKTESELCDLFAESAIYAATSCYEPFGLAVLEAALSKCALVLNDIPSFHELWDDTALYFRHNDADSLAECIELLDGNSTLRHLYANRAHERALERYTVEPMLQQYETLYHRLASAGACA